MKYLTAACLFLLVAGLAFADIQMAPEIDPGSASNALALLSGAGLILVGRRKR